MSKYVLTSNMTLSELSKKSGVPYSTIQEYFSSKKDISKCSMGTFRKIANTLGMTMDSLYFALLERAGNKSDDKYAKVKIPEKFRGSFWDRDFDNLDVDYEKDFIIARLFVHAGFSGAKYVEDTFDKEDIVHAIKTRRDLNPVVANFLQKTYSLKKEDMAYYTVVHDTGNDWR